MLAVVSEIGKNVCFVPRMKTVGKAFAAAEPLPLPVELFWATDGLVLGDWARNVSMLYDRTVKYRAEFAALTSKPAAIDDCCWACNPWLTLRAIPQACGRSSPLAVARFDASARVGTDHRTTRFHHVIGSASSLTPTDVHALGRAPGTYRSRLDVGPNPSGLRQSNSTTRESGIDGKSATILDAARTRVKSGKSGTVERGERRRPITPR